MQDSVANTAPQTTKLGKAVSQITSSTAPKGNAMLGNQQSMTDTCTWYNLPSHACMTDRMYKRVCFTGM